MITLSNLKNSPGSRKKPKRVGRGSGSGMGKTCGRGQKGQKSRSGGKPHPWFEGGQMPLQRRLPKRGFTNIFKKKYALINIKGLSRFEPDSVLDVETLIDAGLVKRVNDGIKLVGDGEISHPLVIKVHKASKTAVAKIEAAGGRVEIL